MHCVFSQILEFNHYFFIHDRNVGFINMTIFVSLVFGDLDDFASKVDRNDSYREAVV